MQEKPVKKKYLSVKNIAKLSRFGIIIIEVYIVIRCLGKKHVSFFLNTDYDKILI